MCELFGLSAHRPLAGWELPLAAFRDRGGGAADNPDGWGIAWRVGAGFQLEKEAAPACQSALFAGMLRTWRGDLAIAHVRKAKYPPINSPANTHPFLQDCCARRWAFAHNGLVPDVVALESASDGRVCRPEGETDSEFAFCHLLAQVTPRFGTPDWLNGLSRSSGEIARLGQFNFLLSEGEHLIAYGHDRLHYLESAVGVVLIATEPLSHHAGWTPFAPGELRIYRDGRRIHLPRHAAH
ncbi:MAG: class II glutamine amidotransferase [Pseudomonadota bacterium]|nr:class II glutamine amidotransferase [Pseudomonadota bacterium]